MYRTHWVLCSISSDKTKPAKYRRNYLLTPPAEKICVRSNFRVLFPKTGIFRTSLLVLNSLRPTLKRSDEECHRDSIRFKYFQRYARFTLTWFLDKWMAFHVMLLCPVRSSSAIGKNTPIFFFDQHPNRILNSSSSQCLSWWDRRPHESRSFDIKESFQGFRDPI